MRKMEGKQMQNYSDHLAELAIVILDHYCTSQLPEAIAWLLPTLKEALFSPDSYYQEWIAGILAYVACECGVPLPQEEEYESAS